MTHRSVHSGSDEGRAEPDSEILAAGAVLYRHAAGGVEVALIHRRRHDDWTFPKGKLEPGEHVIAAAVREVTEETGIRPVLGRPLATVRYPVEGRPKRVNYWAALVDARSSATPLVPNNEVDDLDWLPLSEAVTRLTYSHDRRLLDLLTDPAGGLVSPAGNGGSHAVGYSPLTDAAGPGAARDDVHAENDTPGAGNSGQSGDAGSQAEDGDPLMDGTGPRAGDSGQARHAGQVGHLSPAGRTGQAEHGDRAGLAGKAEPASEAGRDGQAVRGGRAGAGPGEWPGPARGDTVPCILLRHASAGSKDTWHGDDLLRPLDGQGIADARTLAGLLACYAPTRVISSPAERCLGTMRPYAERIGAAIEAEPVFTAQSGNGEDLRTAAQHRMTELLARPSPMVICAHRENISVLLDQACAILSTAPAPPEPSPDDPAWRGVEPHNSFGAADWSPPKGGFWVLHIAGGQLSALEHHDLTT